jgi:hypothetical protein
MGLIWLLLAALALWTLVRLGRQGERPGRGQWRIAATVLGAVLLGCAILAGSHGAWLATAGLAGGGLYLIFSSRLRPPPLRRDRYGGDSLSEAEARSTLGVGPGADRAEIQAAWKRLMARVHPDQGGAEGLAARLNAARDRLLKR